MPLNILGKRSSSARSNDFGGDDITNVDTIDLRQSKYTKLVAGDTPNTGNLCLYANVDDKMHTGDEFGNDAVIGGGGGGASTLQEAYDGGSSITTTGSVPMSITATTGDALIIGNGGTTFTVAGTGVATGQTPITGSDLATKDYVDGVVGTGLLNWAQYKDTQYTTGNRLVLTGGNEISLPNNAADNIISYMPAGVSFYDGTKITPQSVGETYDVRLSFRAESSTQSNLDRKSVV